MTTRTAISLSLSALMLGGSMVGCTAHPGGVAAMTDAASGRAQQLAESEAVKARKALAEKNGAAAVAAAENAVRWQPQQAGYRTLLGQSYLTAGRFVSARDAFADALTLNPDDGRAALSLALAQIATGSWEAARATLAAHAEHIPAADRGLAIALAGDPAAAIDVLTAAARAEGAEAKTRQNLALALALAGRWTESRAVAALDLAPDEVDRRMVQWSAFAYPKGAADQVASLLGVTPVADGGQPAALALNTAPKTADGAPVAVAAADPAPAPAPAVAPKGPVTPAAETDVAVVAPATAPVEVAAAPVAVTAPNPAQDARPSVVFAAAKPVVQAIPAVAPVAKPGKVAVVRAKPVAPAKGNFYVQLGAYDNAGVARDGWTRATRRYTGFAQFAPQGMQVSAKGASFYRLSVGGFARPQADALCQAYRAKGGICFVRAGAGDQVAQWASAKRVQLAAR
ncbi:MAG: tetratricopeptide repeat protein [Sphingomonas sp.]